MPWRAAEVYWLPLCRDYLTPTVYEGYTTRPKTSHTYAPWAALFFSSTPILGLNYCPVKPLIKNDKKSNPDASFGTFPFSPEIMKWVSSSCKWPQIGAVWIYVWTQMEGYERYSLDTNPGKQHTEIKWWHETLLLYRRTKMHTYSSSYIGSLNYGFHPSGNMVLKCFLLGIQHGSWRFKNEIIVLGMAEYNLLQLNRD